MGLWRPVGLPPLFDEEGWLGGHTFSDRVSWLPDDEAARVWGERYRSGVRDLEGLKYDLDFIAYLCPAEADACLRWLHAEPGPEPNWGHSLPGGRRLSWAEFLEYLAGLIHQGRRIHELSAATADERRREAEALRELPREDPTWHRLARVVVLAEARVDPHRAAELALEVWGQRGALNPAGEGEVARRLWLRDPDAALAFLDRQRRPHCAGLLPILLQRVLTDPSKESHRLAVELLARLKWCTWPELCLSVVRVLGAVESWPPADRLALLDATVREVTRFQPDNDWARPRHVAFKMELAIHLSTLPLTPEDAAALTELLYG